MAKKERLKDFEMMTMDSISLIDELKGEIEGSGNLKYIKELLEWGHFDVNVIWLDENEQDCSFLMLASNLNKPKIVKVLLDAGADPNVKDTCDDTALMIASARGHLQVVQVLLENPQTDPNLKNEEWGDGYGSTALIDASGRGHSQVVKTLLSHPKIDPNLRERDGFTALHLASYHGYSRVVKLLLKHPNIDISIENDGEETAWDIASAEILEKFPELNPNNTKAIDKKLRR